jgi:hypothetical protein
LLTLTSAMGPLMDAKDKRCLKSEKGKKNWKRYVKGASAIFARYACGRGVVRVLTLPPSRAEFLRPLSSDRTLEEPVLKGSTGYCCAAQTSFVRFQNTRVPDLARGSQIWQPRVLWCQKFCFQTSTMDFESIEDDSKRCELIATYPNSLQDLLERSCQSYVI